MVRNFNRIWILIILGIVMLATAMYFDNPYLNVLIFGIGGAIFLCVGAWISDTIKENEERWMTWIAVHIMRINPADLKNEEE